MMLLNKFTKSLISKYNITQEINWIHTTGRCFANQHLPASNSNETAESSLLEIESNLFENSLKNSTPIKMDKLLDKYKKPNKFARKPSAQKSQSKPTASPAPPLPITPVKSSIITNDELNVTYKKLQLNDPWLQKLMMMVKSKKYRYQKHQLLMEGRRLLIDAISAGLQMEYLLFSDRDKLKQIKDYLSAETKIIKVPQSDLSFWSTLTTCPGLMGIFNKPLDMETIAKSNNNNFPVTVICDQIREPNNLGSIIRICAAIPCAQIFVIKGCADPWETKALRGGAGAHFRIPIKGPIEWSSVKSFLPDYFSMFIAENNEQNTTRHINNSNELNKLKSYEMITFDKNIHNVIVIGGETQGVSTDAYQFLQESGFGSCVHIPLADGIESLNTASALAIILFELRKQIMTTNNENVSILEE